MPHKHITWTPVYTTSLHLIEGFWAVESFTVLAGTVDLTSGGERREVKQYITHLDYDAEDNYLHDIAVLEDLSPHWAVESFTVLAGTVDLTSGGERREVKQYITHLDYDAEDNYLHDIAVLELKTALPVSTSGNIQAVTLPTQGQTTDAGLTATVPGWGYLYTGGPTSDVLMYVDLLTYSDDECGRLLAGNAHDTNICAGVSGGGKGHCGGDSGGPLIVNGYQAGIVSWSVKPCASPPYPGVYTEVAHYVNWIKSRTGLTL
ncbi:hypothetical protein C0J52_16336 [Blattella germanica]|nr:hypothetical protein C0J52_16336 [Blattella germanica]